MISSDKRGAKQKYLIYRSCTGSVYCYIGKNIYVTIGYTRGTFCVQIINFPFGSSWSEGRCLQLFSSSHERVLHVAEVCEVSPHFKKRGPGAQSPMGISAGAEHLPGASTEIPVWERAAGQSRSPAVCCSKVLSHQL